MSSSRSSRVPAATHAVGLALELGGHAARLVHQQEAGGLVPALQAALVVRVHPARRHVGEVQCRGAGPAQVADPWEERHQELRLLGAALRLV